MPDLKLAGCRVVWVLVALVTAGCAATPALHVIGVYEGEPQADQSAEKEVIVNVSDSSRPVVLVLTAYDKTLWRLNLKEGINLARLILAGYHTQRVTGIPLHSTIETYTYDPSPCDRCMQNAEYFYSYDAPHARLKEITGLDVTSFQGRYRGGEFSIVTRSQDHE